MQDWTSGAKARTKEQTWLYHIQWVPILAILFGIAMLFSSIF
jgi:hypothetical protein